MTDLNAVELVANLGFAVGIGTYLVYWMTTRLNGKMDKLSNGIEKLNENVNKLNNNVERLAYIIENRDK